MPDETLILTSSMTDKLGASIDLFVRRLGFSIGWRVLDSIQLKNGHNGIFRSRTNGVTRYGAHGAIVLGNQEM